MTAPPPPGRRRGRLVIAALLPLPGCAGPVAVGGDLTAIAADEASLCIRTHGAPVPVTVEVARTNTSRAAGLSGRATLAPQAGMLFLYRRPRPADSGFWMYRTRIPLDIAYLDTQGHIRAIHHMEPCGTEPAGCPVYPATVQYQAALEVNAGFFSRHGIVVGDRLVVSGPECPE